MIFKTKRIFSFQNIIISASVLPILIFGFLTYSDFEEQSVQNTYQRLENINEHKKQIIEEYFKKIEFDINELTKNISFLQKQASNNITNIQLIQKKHIENFYNSSLKDTLSLAKKDLFQYIYSFRNRGKSVNKKYIDEIYAYKEAVGLKNVLMINAEGKILYSSDQAELLNKNVVQLSKPFKNIWDEVKSLKFRGEDSIRFVSMGYDSFSKTYKQYVISPFKDVKGFIAVELNQNTLQEAIRHVSSLGESAETYLAYIDNDKTYLASKRSKKLGDIGDEKTGIYIDKGFDESSVDIKYGSKGDIELVGYMPIKVKNIHLSMQTTVAYTNVISPQIKGASYFEQFMVDYGYHNIMLIDFKGKMYYSVNKERDFETNILSGKYSDTHLAKALVEVLKSRKFILSDIDIYEPCKYFTSQFALLPLIDKNDNIQSVVVLAVDIEVLTKKLAGDEDIFLSKETYVVGKDNRLRTDTVLEPLKYNSINSFKSNVKIDTQATRDAFSGEEATVVVKDYRGVDVLSSFRTIEFPDFTWAVVTEVDKSEIDEMLSELKFNILLFVFISSIVALIVMFIITNEKKKQDEKLKHNASHDSLTGLPNRKFVLEFLTYILANKKRSRKNGAVLFMDLDNFKIINDSYGHKSGDFVLKVIAERLHTILREEDFLARLGGDEFVLIVNEYSNISDIDTICSKIIDSISQEIDDGERVYKVGVSIGIATFPDDSNDAQKLLQFSDTAMYGTKDSGKNGYTYYNKDMTKESLRISQVERELKYAILNNELELYYQPQVDIKRDKIVAVEALVRWNHPEKGLIMPSNFISIAEESDLILELGRWVTEEACRNFKAWKDSGSELNHISVNMSTRRIECLKCVEHMKEIFENSDFNPEWLELEITESTLISNMNNALSSINHFKEMGIKFAIDDFGTGYSSLSYLKSLHVSTIKIDREFIKDILVDKDDFAIVSAIIAMAKALNYAVVAEGVEQKGELELLKELECDIIQGYYFAKPLREEELLKYIENFKKRD